MNFTMKELGEFLAGILNTELTEKTHSLEIGKCYLIRTVTFYYVGKLISITDSDLVLEQASWISDTGRFSNALTSGVFNEVEPYPNKVMVNRDVIVDYCEWDHDLPKEQK
jgi:hypothetical protein